MDDERGTITITLPPPPEGAIGQRLFCVQSQTVYPWWLPSWLMQRLPGPLWIWAQRFGPRTQARYVELTWQEFVERYTPPSLPVHYMREFHTDEPPKWNDA